jgi:hypothetical protein
LCLALQAAPAALAQNYQVGNFDVYKYSTNGEPIPDVDKPLHGHLNTCWMAAASNVLAAAGYGIGAPQVNPTAQQRADHIYGQIFAAVGDRRGWCERGVNWWLYTHGKNPTSPDYMPDNPYTDVTVVDREPGGLTLADGAGGIPRSDYNFLLDELTRCQYVTVGFYYPEHAMTLVGGNYWPNPNGKPDGNVSVWHDSDGPAMGDHPDTVTHPAPVGVLVDDDVYTNGPIGANWWSLTNYPTQQADRYMTLCEGLNKDDSVVRNYDAAYYLQDTDADGFLDDPAFRVAGAANYGNPQWIDEMEVEIPNEPIQDLYKIIQLLVDYKDRVPGREAVEIVLLRDDNGVLHNPTSVTPSPDDGQLLFIWELDYQPAFESLVFPNNAYSLLNSYVKDWNVATECVPEPATLALLIAGAAGIAAVRRRRRKR